MTSSSHTAFVPPQALPLAPGDQVVRYINGQPSFCTVISVERNQKIRVSCQLWSTHGTALVDQRDLVPINYITP